MLKIGQSAGKTPKSVMLGHGDPSTTMYTQSVCDGCWFSIID
ncbi:hypothetical protein BMW23_0470 [Bodo saltans virus]|uniref:Uncharacterized protein n=1 Tax=Bodo saltans virus TaxID=2024608 RepID=A0A2H4UUB3_9VIRU|nr:hypothetical protein QJ851_gp0459 [Bodo saltans virus]ATZ80522.1 hypothetical protein BMW23_0470 [Bodo saltans virus]